MDFAIGFVVLLVVTAIYGIKPTLAVLWLPVLLLLAVLTALGVGLWMSALNALYRDVRYVVPFLIQFWMFASPVAYPSSLVPQAWRWLYSLNPMAGVIDGFRWALTGHGVAPGGLMLASACRGSSSLSSVAYSSFSAWRAPLRTACSSTLDLWCSWGEGMPGSASRVEAHDR